MSIGLRITVYLATMWVAKYTVAQLPFTLDTAFRTGITQQNVNDLYLLPDGGIFLSGQIRFPGDMYTRGSAKLQPNGSRDVSFPAFPLTTGGAKIVPWNNQFYVSNGLVRRMTSEGLVDPSFILMNDDPFFSSQQPGDYHVYPDGRVLVSGQHQLRDSVRGSVGFYNLCWFSSTGYLDTTRIHRKGPGIVFRFRQLPDGGFICNGTANTFEGVAVDRIFKVDSLGVPDTTFRTGVTSGFVNAYLPMQDGRVYVAGIFSSPASAPGFHRLVRYQPDGALDPTFAAPDLDLGVLSGSNGPAVVNITPWGNGNIIVTGQFQAVNGQARYGICMLDSTGQLLPAFENAGVDIFNYQNYDYAYLGAVVLDTTNGFIYVAGGYNGYNDGVTNDPQQRFVSRLFLGDLPTEVVLASAAPPFLLYPNPAAGQVTVRLAEPATSTYLLIRDALGRVVLERSVQDRLTSLELDHLAAGTYVLELQHNGQRSTQRLVVQQ